MPAHVSAKPQESAAGSEAEAPGVRQELDWTVSQLNAGQPPATPAGADNASVVFRRIYDQARMGGTSRSLSAGAAPTGAVAGRQEQVVDRIGQLAALAQAASIYDAPKLYQDSLQQTRDAARDKALDAGLARKLVQALLAFVLPQGRDAVPQLAKAAAAAGPDEAARPLKAIKDWDKLFDLFGKPAPRRDPQTQALIAIALDHVKTGAVPPAGERSPSAGMPGASAVKLLPPMRIADLERDAVFPERAWSWLDDVLAAHSRNPGADPFLLYQIARRGAGKVVPAAAASAAGQSARAWLAQAWNWLRAFYLRYFGPQAAVDLGGIVVRGPASEVSGLSSLRRAPSAIEAQMKDSRVAVVPVDLSAVERPYGAALRLLGSEAALPAARVSELLAQGDALAEASRKLTGDPSGLQEYRRLRDRLADQGELSRLDARLWGYWLGVLREAAFSRVELASLEAARRGGPVVLSDLSKDGLLIVAAPQARDDSLSRLGFDIAGSQGGVALARLSLAGLSPSARREALASAVSAAAGHDASALAGGPARRDAVALLAFVRSNPGQARDAAVQLETEAPFVSRRFETLGRVTTPQGAFLLERSRRLFSGRLEVIDVLRGESGRAAFARKTIAPLPR